MIDDATLSGWELTPSPNGYLQLAVKEIRRLRKAYAGLAPVAIELRTERDNLQADLAAHQAVVRELAKVLHPFTFPTEFEGSFIVMDHDVNRAREAIAHPLVVAARKEKA